MSNDEQKFKDDIEKASQLAEAYDGTEASFKELFGDLEKLEEWFEQTFGEKLSLSNEQDFIEKNFPAEKIPNVMDVLEIAAKSFRERIKNNLQYSVYTITTEKVILKPGSGEINHGIGEGSMKPAKFHPRREEILEFLVENGIYLDDIIMVEGEVKKDMMRKKSYVIIEVPRINKQILVCDQIGEATFVIKTIVNRDNFYNKSKEDLQDTFGDQIVQIKYRDKEQWLQEIHSSLFAEGDAIGPKINIKDLEQLRNEIMRLMTSAEWVAMNSYEKRKLKIPEKTGIGLIEIARTFGLEGRPMDNTKIHLELGFKIYGRDDLNINEAIDFYDPIKLKEMIKKLKTPEMWVAMGDKERLNFKVPEKTGHGMSLMAGIFGMEGVNVIQNNKHALELGKKIYGEDNEVINYALAFYDTEKLKDQIRKLMTAQEWANMGMKARRDFKYIKTMRSGLASIATMFGIDGDPTANLKFHLELGRKIFGEESM